MFILLPALLAMPPNSSKVPPPPPGIAVTVSERGLELPPIPESVAKAHAGYPEVREMLVDELQGLERNLISLYASPESRIPLPASFQVPRSRAEEIKFLVSVLGGERYQEFQGPVLRAWEEWQAVLAESERPDVSHDAAPPIVSPGRVEETRAMQRRRKGMMPSETALKAERDALVSLFTVPGRGTNWEAVALVQENRTEERKAIAQASIARKVADRHVPQVSAAWAPMAARLNADAARLADLDAAPSPGDPGMIALRIQAKIQFLEQFRSALWLCGVVWARLTSSAPPVPLRRLAPLPIPDSQTSGPQR